MLSWKCKMLQLWKKNTYAGKNSTTCSCWIWWKLDAVQFACGLRGELDSPFTHWVYHGGIYLSENQSIPPDYNFFVGGILTHLSLQIQTDLGSGKQMTMNETGSVTGKRHFIFFCVFVEAPLLQLKAFVPGLSSITHLHIGLLNRCLCSCPWQLSCAPLPWPSSLQGISEAVSNIVCLRPSASLWLTLVKECFYEPIKVSFYPSVSYHRSLLDGR